MRIALGAPIWYPIPPVGYGGIELVVDLLAGGLAERGHDLTLFASGDSNTKAKLVSSYDVAPSARIGEVYPDLFHALSVYERAGEFDIIHDHTGMIGPAIGAFIDTPVLHTLHGPATEESKRLYRKLNFGLYFNAISQYQREQFGNLNFVDTIYNAIDLDSYPYRESKGEYLLFLGRMNPEKGAHIAVEVANRLGRKLWMVSKMTEPHEKRYFETQVAPILSDNIELLGEVDPVEKAELFANAQCTLFPIQWPEPFGLVAIESLATGTPVVAMGTGAVPEILEDGRTGFIVSSVDEMVEAVDKTLGLKPKDCRQAAEQRFSKDRLLADYEAAYKKAISSDAAARAA